MDVDVNVSDASKGYYCSVTVDDLNDVFHQEAPSVELEVYDQLRVTQGIQDVVQKLGSTTPATFTCNISGVPQPEIRSARVHVASEVIYTLVEGKKELIMVGRDEDQTI